MYEGAYARARCGPPLRGTDQQRHPSVPPPRCLSLGILAYTRRRDRLARLPGAHPEQGGTVDLPVQDVVGAVAVAVGALVLNLLVLLLEIVLIMRGRGP